MTRRSFFIRVLAAASVLVVGAVSGQATDPHPPLRTRRAVERHVVVVEVRDAVAGVISSGLGIIVAEDREFFHLATAAHVLRSHRAEGTRVRILAHGHAHWIDAEVLARGTPAAGDPEAADFAFLRIPVRLTEFVPGALVSSLLVAPSSVAEPGTGVWAIGYDDYNETRLWKPGTVEERAGPFVLFTGREVREGFSGGLLCAAGGALAMTLSVGRRGRASKALRLEALAKAAAELGVPYGVAARPVSEALSSCARNHLLATLYEHDTSRWYALSVVADDGGGFSGEWMTYGPDRYLDSEGSSGSWRGALEGDEFVIDRGAGSARIPLQPCAAPVIDGHLVLQGRDEQSGAYFAVPSGICELLPARLIASRRNHGFALQSGALLSHAHTVRSGIRIPFAMALVADFRYGTEVAFAFRVHEAWRAEPLRLTGRLLLADIGGRRPAGGASHWRQCPVHVVDIAGARDVAVIRRDDTSPDDAPFDVEFELADREFALALRARQGEAGGALIIQAPVLFRGDR